MDLTPVVAGSGQVSGDGRRSVSEVLEKIARLDSDIQAFTYIKDFEANDIEPCGQDAPLRYVPFAVKDMIDVEGVPTRLGLTELEYNPPPAGSSAAVVKRLEKSGAVFVGKTTTSALAMDRPALTRNPRDVSRSPGTSSSGSAAAVAAGMVPLALGSQTIGSVIRPASYCGVWAFVPSLHAVPLDGTFWVSPALERIGIFATTAEWLARGGEALLTTLVSGHCECEQNSGRSPRIGILAGVDFGLEDDGFREGFEALVKEFGDVFVRIERDFDAPRILRVAKDILVYEANSHLRSRKDFVESVGIRLEDLVAAGPARSEYDEALHARAGIVGEWRQTMSGLDALLLPSAVGEAPAGANDMQDTAPSAFGSLLGGPTLNVPFFRSRNGLPLGCQLIARHGEDLELLRLGTWLAHTCEMT
ncbi:amidase family protein [Mesorhizobium sp. A623]